MDSVHILADDILMTPSPRRTGYRHGDLHRALLDAGVEMARRAGPDAVVLREATRRAGVAPNAAYRHFADRAALLDAVCGQARGMLAAAMSAELARTPGAATAADTARARLRAIGAAYLTFAREQPGLFRTAFAAPDDVSDVPHAGKAGSGDATPFSILAGALDELVATGAVPVDRRPNAEFTAWSAVHGLAMLLVQGPLRGIPSAQVEQLSEHLLTVIERGL